MGCPQRNAIKWLALMVLVLLPILISSTVKAQTGFITFGAGTSQPFGEVSGLPGNVKFPAMDATDVFDRGVVFDFTLGAIFEDWLFEAAVHGHIAVNPSDSTRKAIEAELGSGDYDLAFGVPIEFVVGRVWQPFENATFTAGIGNGLAMLQTRGPKRSDGDGGYSMSARIGMEWRPFNSRLIIRPLLRTQLIVAGSEMPHFVSFTIGVGALQVK